MTPIKFQKVRLCKNHVSSYICFLYFQLNKWCINGIAYSNFVLSDILKNNGKTSAFILLHCTQFGWISSNGLGGDSIATCSLKNYM